MPYKIWFTTFTPSSVPLINFNKSFLRQEGHWLPLKALTRSVMLHYYSNPRDKQGHETKPRKVGAWRAKRAALSQQTLRLSFRSTSSSAPCCCVWKGLYLLDSVICSLTGSQSTLCFPDAAGAAWPHGTGRNIFPSSIPQMRLPLLVKEAAL